MSYRYVVTAFTTDRVALDIGDYFTPDLIPGAELPSRIEIQLTSARKVAEAMQRIRSGRADSSTRRRTVAYVVSWLVWDDTTAAIPEIYLTPAGRKYGTTPHVPGRMLTDSDLLTRLS